MCQYPKYWYQDTHGSLSFEQDNREQQLTLKKEHRITMNGKVESITFVISDGELPSMPERNTNTSRLVSKILADLDGIEPGFSVMVQDPPADSARYQLQRRLQKEGAKVKVAKVVYKGERMFRVKKLSDKEWQAFQFGSAEAKKRFSKLSKPTASNKPTPIPPAPRQQAKQVGKGA